MYWIVSIGGALGLVYCKYGAQYNALEALKRQVADYLASPSRLLEAVAWHVLPGSVHRYIWPPHNVAVIPYRSRDSRRRGLIVLEKVDDDLNVAVIEVEMGRGRPQCARCPREDPQSSESREFCFRCEVCYCSQKCRKADARKHRHTCTPV